MDFYGFIVYTHLVCRSVGPCAVLASGFSDRIGHDLVHLADNDRRCVRLSGPSLSLSLCSSTEAHNERQTSIKKWRSDPLPPTL